MDIFSLSEIYTVSTAFGDREIAQWLKHLLYKPKDQR